jgi:hypothetical protein
MHTCISAPNLNSSSYIAIGFSGTKVRDLQSIVRFPNDFKWLFSFSSIHPRRCVPLPLCRSRRKA